MGPVAGATITKTMVTHFTPLLAAQSLGANGLTTVGAAFDAEYVDATYSPDFNMTLMAVRSRDGQDHAFITRHYLPGLTARLHDAQVNWTTDGDGNPLRIRSIQNAILPIGKEKVSFMFVRRTHTEETQKKAKKNRTTMPEHSPGKLTLTLHDMIETLQLYDEDDFDYGMEGRMLVHDEHGRPMWRDAAYDLWGFQRLCPEIARLAAGASFIYTAQPIAKYSDYLAEFADIQASIPKMPREIEGDEVRISRRDAMSLTTQFLGVGQKLAVLETKAKTEERADQLRSARGADADDGEDSEQVVGRPIQFGLLAVTAFAHALFFARYTELSDTLLGNMEWQIEQNLSDYPEIRDTFLPIATMMAGKG